MKFKSGGNPAPKKAWNKTDNPPPKSPGRPPASPEQKALRKYTIPMIAGLINNIMDMSLDDLRLFKERGDVPAIEAVFANVVFRCRMQGDMTDIERMLARCIGHVPQEIRGKFGGLNGEPLPTPVIQFLPVAPPMPDSTFPASWPTPPAA